MSTLAFLVGVCTILYGILLDIFNAMVIVSNKYKNSSQVVLLPAILYAAGYLILRIGSSVSYGTVTLCAIFCHFVLVVVIPFGRSRHGGTNT